MTQNPTSPGEGGRDWSEVEAEVLASLQSVIERQVKAASERLYDDLLSTTQDYLAENLRWNIASRLEATERSRRLEWERAEAAAASAEYLKAVLRQVRNWTVISDDQREAVNAAIDRATNTPEAEGGA